MRSCLGFTLSSTCCPRLAAAAGQGDQLKRAWTLDNVPLILATAGMCTVLLNHETCIETFMEFGTAGIQRSFILKYTSLSHDLAGGLPQAESGEWSWDADGVGVREILYMLWLVRSSFLNLLIHSRNNKNVGCLGTLAQNAMSARGVVSNVLRSAVARHLLLGFSRRCPMVFFGQLLLQAVGTWQLLICSACCQCRCCQLADGLTQPVSAGFRCCNWCRVH